ncbi:MAG TPA: hypothetical protein VFH29_03770, partial [Anaerolineales bacterium]|nr:hypothetical protein [Anaerolineales bacterium]
VIVALTLNHVLRKYVPVVSTLPEDSTSLFWVLSIVLGALVFFGYQTVALIPHLQSKATRERLQDSLFGVIVGGLNGFLIFGTILFYLAQTKYQALPNVVVTPPPDIQAAIESMMGYMPPQMLGEPAIYFAVILCFIFVIVVYI